ncbi:MAG: NAD(P)-dependent oxidoreductase [Pseudomonadota bacterium]
MSQKRQVAFLGLGVMGFPMAGFLAKSGHTVTVYNRTPAKAEAWLKSYPGKAAPTAHAAACEADFVFACVGNDDDIRAVTLGEDGAFSAMRAGTIFVDHTTTSAACARSLATHATQHGFSFLDAPVSGGQAGAQSGTLTVMIGGEADAAAGVEPLIATYARMQQRIGPTGSGQLTKMVNQICIAGIVQGLAEALHFGKAADLDLEAVIDVISKGAAQSWQMENRAHTMIEGQFDFGFAVDWMRKDLGYVLEEARRNGSTLPLTALVDQYYGQVQALGGNRADTSSLIQPLETVRTSSKKA